ncbi:DEKNAAC100970 [Brettanomyces naardenensis]|uniref:DEKNAAC100970 n=1 Tax=Brettanomyces naardenensis TaxID=13370 RepID=A0A448YH05_BRENA|nr:DEKNAAC100970 [Brettanomyces naardenensis]
MESESLPKSHHYEDVPSASIVGSNEKYAVDFTSLTAERETLGLLEYRCPIKGCETLKFSSFKQLNEHVRELHNKVYCTLCAKFKKAFISELRLYTTRDFQMHQTKGCSDEEGFTGHPVCKFCGGKRFYSEDELFIHMRDRHERCHVCDQIDSTNPQYFKDYNHLFKHFQDSHYACGVQSCLDKKFVVFRDEFDLQAHMIKEHGDIYGTDRLILTPTMQPNGFGTQLSTLRDENRPSNPTSDSHEVKKLRLEERARHYLHYSQDDFARFQEATKLFDDGNLSAPELLEQYKVIFGSTGTDEQDLVDYGVLLYELSRLYPSSSPKRKEIEAINSQQMRRRELEEKFPELPGATTDSSFVANNWGTRRNFQQGSSRANQMFPALPSAPGVSFSSARMGRSSSSPTWAPPINAASVPGYFPRKAKRPTSHSASSTSLTSGNSSASSSTQSLSSLLGNTSKSSRGPTTRTGTSTHATYRFSPSPVLSSQLDERKYPKLPEARSSLKKPITRVKPVNKSIGQWENRIPNGSSSEPPRQEGVFETQSLRQALGSSNGKKKKNKVVFHIGVGN